MRSRRFSLPLWLLVLALMVAVLGGLLLLNGVAHLWRQQHAPRLEVLTPAPGATVPAGEALPIQVRVRAQGAPVRWVQLWIDGTLSGQRIGPMEDQTILWVWVPTAGEHILYFLALAQDNARALLWRPILATPAADEDGDGLANSLDACPQEPGDLAHQGCPLPNDSDHDGLPDAQDACPQQAGAPEDQGCPWALLPDGDADGLPDLHDRCPQDPGPPHLQGCPTLGLSHDRDGDGLPDAQDACPQEAGPANAQGCPHPRDPDRDGDGVPNQEDQCPDQPGPAVLQGCPWDAWDADGDGLRNLEDACPDQPGPRERQGCPQVGADDRDGDGVPDEEDRCPDQPGPVEWQGCPLAPAMDADGDGFPDPLDRCPDTPGVVDGCPSVSLADTDHDGVLDPLDQCPEQAGPPPEGCPLPEDQDGDGVRDAADNCPTLPGPPEHLGCPPQTLPPEVLEAFDRPVGGVLCALIPRACAVVDPCELGDCTGVVAQGIPVDSPARVTGACRAAPWLCGCTLYPGPRCDSDGDGLPNREDRCPEEIGLPELGGCPALLGDADSDGVLDREDECPTQMGDPLYQGCPNPGDHDLDGVPDDWDQCPDLNGLPEHQGCLEEGATHEVVIHLIALSTAPEWHRVFCTTPYGQVSFEAAGDGMWYPEHKAQKSTFAREGETIALRLGCYGMRSDTGGAYLLGEINRPIGTSFWDSQPRWIRAENPAIGAWMEVAFRFCLEACP